jgi:hypothetical protein
VHPVRAPAIRYAEDGRSTRCKAKTATRNLPVSAQPIPDEGSVAAPAPIGSSGTSTQSSGSVDIAPSGTTICADAGSNSTASGSTGATASAGSGGAGSDGIGSGSRIAEQDGQSSGGPSRLYEARQMAGLISDVAGLTDEVRVQGAMLIRLDSRISGLDSTMSSVPHQAA